MPTTPDAATTRAPRSPRAQRALDRRLVHALVGHQFTVVRAVLAEGADPNCRVADVTPVLQPRLGDSLVGYAARQGSLTLVMALVCAGARLDTVDDPIHRPLQAALAQGHPAIAAWLVDAGADPRPTDQHGLNALQLAARSSYLDVVRAILRRTPELVNQTADGESTALHTAVFCRDLPLIDLLLAAGADPLRRDALGRTAVHEAVALSNRYVATSTRDSDTCLRRLLAAGVSVAAADGADPTLLYSAVWSGDAACTVLLLQQGAAVTDDVRLAVEQFTDAASHPSTPPTARPSILEAVGAALADGTLTPAHAAPFLLALLRSSHPALRATAICLIGDAAPPCAPAPPRARSRP